MDKLEEFWLGIVRANPGFGMADSTKVTMTIDAIRKLVSKAHRDGFHCGLQMSKSLEDIGNHGVPDIFKDLLKRKKGDTQ